MRPVLALALAALCALLAAGCAATAKPSPPTGGILGDPQHPAPAHPSQVRRPFDPVPSLLRCLRQHNVHGARRTGETVTIGPVADGLRIRFLATAGVTETAQLEGRAEGAEVIGRALLYPGTGPEGIVKRVEDCTGDAGLKE